MGPSLANPFLSIAQILSHATVLQERQHSTVTLEHPNRIKVQSSPLFLLNQSSHIIVEEKCPI